MRRVVTISCIIVLAVAAVVADEPKVSNRVPLPYEIGYRPADGESAQLYPPSFIWLHEPAAASYAIQWSTQLDFSDAQTKDGFLWSTYTHNAPLKAGTR